MTTTTTDKKPTARKRASTAATSVATKGKAAIHKATAPATTAAPAARQKPAASTTPATPTTPVVAAEPETVDRETATKVLEPIAATIQEAAEANKIGLLDEAQLGETKKALAEFNRIAAELNENGEIPSAQLAGLVTLSDKLQAFVMDYVNQEVGGLRKETVVGFQIVREVTNANTTRIDTNFENHSKRLDRLDSTPFGVRIASLIAGGIFVFVWFVWNPFGTNEPIGLAVQAILAGILVYALVAALLDNFFRPAPDKVDLQKLEKMDVIVHPSASTTPLDTTTKLAVGETSKANG